MARKLDRRQLDQAARIAAHGMLAYGMSPQLAAHGALKRLGWSQDHLEQVATAAQVEVDAARGALEIARAWNE